MTSATPRKPASVRQADVQRAVKGAQAAGLRISRIEIEGSRFTLVTDGHTEAPESALEAWRRKNGQG